MSPSIERNPSEFFTVVGSAYVPEGHGDRFDHLAALPESEQLKLGVTSRGCRSSRCSAIPCSTAANR
jgi:hypothetical protein